MEYTAAKLAQVMPLLQEATAKAPPHLQQRGKHLIQATDHVTRMADLLAPFAGFGEMQTLASSFLLPHIHSYIKEVSGGNPTPRLIRFMPVTAAAVQQTGIIGTAAKLFGGRAE